MVKEDGILREALPKMWGEDAPEGTMLREEENQCDLRQVQIQDGFEINTFKGVKK